MSGLREISYYGITDTGLVRKVNQDSYSMHVHNSIGLFVVADGMGGHSHGEIASGKLISGVESYWNELEQRGFDITFPDMVSGITEIIERSNRIIYEEDNRENVCGSTVVGLLLYDEYYALFSVGDSRVYLQKGMKIRQLTFDDVWDNLPEVRESMTEKEIREHQNRGKLVSAVGVQESVSVHTSTGMMKGKQKFIVCSDGLYKYCDESFINRCFIRDFGKDHLEKIGENLMNQVKKNGAKDNVTFILVSSKE